jgi:hypothetical protein
MKKLLLSLSMFSASLIATAQTCPTPTGTGAHVTLDSTYQLGTYRAGKTDVGLCWYNNTSDKLTAAQFRVFYDKDAFSDVDTIISTNTSFNQTLQYVDNPSGGYVTITLVYTGTDATFDIPDGSQFKVTFNHTSALSTTYFTVGNMSFNGSSSFSQTATNQAGSDYTLSLTNFGGVFKSQKMSYKGKFVNVTGTPAKNIAVALEKKLKTSSSWSYVQTSSTNINGRFAFTDVEIDTTAWDVRLFVKGDTMGVGNVISTADAQRINQYVLGTQTLTGFDFYASDVNGDNSVTISDVYGVYARVSGRFTTWSNSVQDVKFFTASEYSTINGSSSNLMGTYAGVTNFTFNIVAGQPDSVTYYVLVPGDANGTGFKRARMTPIEIINPNNANKHIIDVTTFYDNSLKTIEINFPKLGVDEGDVVNVPVSLKTQGIDLGSLQLCMKYDSDLLEFVSLKNELNASYWISFINTKDNMVEWGGYDPSTNQHLVKDGELLFTLQFKSKKSQNEWNKSPLYVSRKFAGDAQAIDLNITPTDGILQVFKVSQGGVVFKDFILYPNPTEGIANLSFKVYKEGNITIGIQDLNGKQIVKLIDGQYDMGFYNNTIDLGHLSAGQYIVILESDDRTTAKRTTKIN